MIWEEVNNYRASLGHKRVADFDSTELRTASYRTTEMNAASVNIDHMRDPNLRHKGYDTECIYATGKKDIPAKFSPLYDTVLTQEEMKKIARDCVDAWIKSNNHNYLIGGIYVKRSTITSIVQVDGTSIRIVVSYHDITPEPSELKNYY